MSNIRLLSFEKNLQIIKKKPLVVMTKPVIKIAIQNNKLHKGL